MKKNVRIAKQLLKIAKQLIAEKSIAAASQEENYSIQQQLEILKSYPRTLEGDTAIHNYISNAFGVLYAKKNGTFDGWRMWQEKCRASVSAILAKANENIAKTGSLGLTPGETEELRVALGFLANPEFLVTIKPGKIDGKNIFQSGPGESNEKAKKEENRWKLPTVSGPGIDKKTQTIALNAPPQKLSANDNWLLNIPQGIINMQTGLKEMVVSWGNRIIGGTEIGTTNDPKRMTVLKTSWTEITDDTLKDLEMKILVKMSKQPQHKFDEFIRCMKKLADQLGQHVSEQSLEEFDKKQYDVIMALQIFNQKIGGYATTYREGIANAMSEYNSMVSTVEAQGGQVNPDGTIIIPTNDGITASVRRRDAGFFDDVKNFGKKVYDTVFNKETWQNLGNKVVNAMSSCFDKLFSSSDKQKAEIKEEIKNVSNKGIEWSMAGQEITQAYKNDINVLQECIEELKKIANE